MQKTLLALILVFTLLNCCVTLGLVYAVRQMIYTGSGTGQILHPIIQPQV